MIGRFTPLAGKIFGRIPVPLRRRVIWALSAKFSAGVSVVALNERQEILLLRHRFRETSDWELPGGILRRGETLENAIVREVGEETGLQIRIERLLTASVPTPLHVDVCYLAHITGGTVQLDPSELLAGRFFAVGAARDVLSPEQYAKVRAATET